MPRKHAALYEADSEVVARWLKANVAPAPTWLPFADIRAAIKDDADLMAHIKQVPDSPHLSLYLTAAGFDEETYPLRTSKKRRKSNPDQRQYSGRVGLTLSDHGSTSHQPSVATC